MLVSKQIAKHLRDVFFGGNWTSVNLKDTLNNVGWEEATTSSYSLNSIAKLTFHINYYVSAILKVVRGGPLDAHDKYSFDCPPIQSRFDWEKLVNKTFTEAELLAVHIEEFPDDQLDKNFADEKYGSNYRNFQGLIEHTHYHLGQIALIKKMLGQQP